MAWDCQVTLQTPFMQSFETTAKNVDFRHKIKNRAMISLRLSHNLLNKLKKKHENCTCVKHDCFNDKK